MDLNPDTNQPVPAHDGAKRVFTCKCLKKEHAESMQSSAACHQQLQVVVCQHNGKIRAD